MIEGTKSLYRYGIATAALMCSPVVFGGGSDVWFQPLTESAPVATPNALPELYSPWVTPLGLSQVNLLSLREVEDEILSPLQSTIHIPFLGRNGSMMDMIAYDDTGEYLFIPHETFVGAGVSRHDIAQRSTHILFEGNQAGLDGDWSDDYGAFDPCRFTPNETLFLGEEWSGQGRIIEVMNPFDAPEDIVKRELNSIANVSHEGINFSEKYRNTIYYVDEFNSGSIYKFVMKRRGDYTRGQTFVLSVDDFAGDAAASYSADVNAFEPRVGMATWVPLTNRNGKPRAGITDPFRNGVSADPLNPEDIRNGEPRAPGRTIDDIFGGRLAADDAGGTPYGRPEDMEVGKLRNGREVIYFAATSENTVYAVEILSSRRARVNVLVDGNTPTNVGYTATTGTLSSPDNLAQDAIGNIYVIEDKPNSDDIGGDIWFVRDVNNDGYGESLDHFMSIQVDGSEATGMIFNPQVPTEFVVAVQHPDSTDLSEVPAGLGDAVWQFDLSAHDNRQFVRRLENAKMEKKKSGFYWWSKFLYWGDRY